MTDERDSNGVRMPSRGGWRMPVVVMAGVIFGWVSASARAEASGCAVLALHGATISTRGPGDVQGLCLAPGATLAMPGGRLVAGGARLAPGATFVPGPTAAAEHVLTGEDLTSDIEEAAAAAAAVSRLACTQSFASLRGGDTVVGTGSTNVVCVRDVALGSGQVLTLRGGLADRFVFEVTGAFEIDGGRIVSDGIPAGNVVYDVVGDGERVLLRAGGATACAGTRLDGMVLALQRNVLLRLGVVNGEVVSGRSVRIAAVRCPSPAGGGTSDASAMLVCAPPGALCNTPTASGCAGATALSVFNPTHYRMIVGSTIVGKIVGARDLTGFETCAGGARGVDVIVKSSTLGNTSICGSLSGCPGSGCTITFCYHAPANGCGTTDVAYKTNGNGANNDILGDGVQNGSSCMAVGYAFVTGAGSPIACPVPTTTTSSTSSTTSTSRSTTTTSRSTTTCPSTSTSTTSSTSTSRTTSTSTSRSSTSSSSSSSTSSSSTTSSSTSTSTSSSSTSSSSSSSTSTTESTTSTTSSSTSTTESTTSSTSSSTSTTESTTSSTESTTSSTSTSTSTTESTTSTTESTTSTTESTTSSTSSSTSTTESTTSSSESTTSTTESTTSTTESSTSTTESTTTTSSSSTTEATSTSTSTTTTPTETTTTITEPAVAICGDEVVQDPEVCDPPGSVCGDGGTCGFDCSYCYFGGS